MHWPLSRAAITHDSNEQSAEIPQNKIHPPKARALSVSAWKNISVRDSRVHIHNMEKNNKKEKTGVLSVSPPRASATFVLFSFFFSYSTIQQETYKATTPLSESGGNQHIICIIWTQTGTPGFLPCAITPRSIMRPAHVTQRQLKSLLFEPVNH